MIFLYLTNAALSELISSKRILFSVTENRLYHNKALADILVDLYCPATKTYINLNFT